jgi:hypothetical protein
VVIIIGGVVAVLASRGGEKVLPGLGQACAEKGPKCAENLTCGADNVCLGAAGFQGCEKPEQCETTRCEAGKCEAQVSIGDTCDSNDDCRSPLTCFQGFCLMPMGQKCTHSSQCVTGNCQDQLCGRAPVVRCPRCPLGQICINGACQVPSIVRDHRLELELEEPIRRTPRIPVP